MRPTCRLEISLAVSEATDTNGPFAINPSSRVQGPFPEPSERPTKLKLLSSATNGRIGELRKLLAAHPALLNSLHIASQTHHDLHQWGRPPPVSSCVVHSMRRPPPARQTLSPSPDRHPHGSLGRVRVRTYFKPAKKKQTLVCHCSEHRLSSVTAVAQCEHRLSSVTAMSTHFASLRATTKVSHSKVTHHSHQKGAFNGFSPVCQSMTVCVKVDVPLCSAGCSVHKTYRTCTSDDT